MWNLIPGIHGKFRFPVGGWGGAEGAHSSGTEHSESCAQVAGRLKSGPGAHILTKTIVSAGRHLRPDTPGPDLIPGIHGLPGPQRGAGPAGGNGGFRPKTYLPAHFLDRARDQSPPVSARFLRPPQCGKQLKDHFHFLISMAGMLAGRRAWLAGRRKRWF